MAPPRKPDGELSRWGAWDRAQALYRVLGDCAMCGTAPAAVRHHRDENPVNNAPANVAFLCRACHARLHMTTETCRRGHLWTPENTYIWPRTGKRVCRACRRLRDQSVNERGSLSSGLAVAPVSRPPAAPGGPAAPP